eukprot:TRINITY_DN35591_c0_g1_i3.p1 TRINITY_DN35591_c0_g1~~TRINITY_DN35591_c0_g1_i3.p1  ORF type:complete len:509 (+),score=58.03 TRINITY_DN35591_c0_g1_i3:209-1528(+)
MAYSVFLCGSQVLLTLKSDIMSVTARMLVSFVLGLTTCAAFCFIAAVGGGESVEYLYLPCLVNVSLLAVCNSLLQTALFGVAGAISQELSAAAMLGMGISGLVGLAVSLLVQALQKANHIDGDSGPAGMVVTLVLFLSCIVQMLVSVWVYFIYIRLRLPETRIALADMEDRRSSRSPTSSPSSASSRARAATMRENLARQRQNLDFTMTTVPVSSTPNEAPLPPLSVTAESIYEDGAVQAETCLDVWRRIKPVLWEVSPQAANVFGVFLVTMCIFPGVLVHWLPRESFRSDKQMYGTLLIGCFQVGDCIGRYAAGPFKEFNPKRLWLLVLLRFIFIPLFMFGQRIPDASPVWGSDIGRFSLCLAFAVSNGLVASLAMMFGPASCRNVDDKELAGIAMSATMVTGIFTGTLVAFSTQIGITSTDVPAAVTTTTIMRVITA